MRVSSLALFSIMGAAEAASISGETIQHHMNKLDKLRLMKHSHQVVQGRKLDDSASYQAYGSNSNNNQNNYGSYASDNGYNKNYGSYQQNNYNQNGGQNNYNKNGGQNNYNGNNADNEYYMQDVNQYYFQNMRQGDFQIDGTKTIEFERCVSLRSLNEEIAQYEGKNMQSTSDFVIFKVTDMYEKEFEFAVGISDFVDSLISTIPDDREEYCQVCQQSFQTCQQQETLNEWNSVVQNTGNIGNYYGFNNKQKENEESNMKNWGWGGSNYYAQDYYAANGNNRRKLQEEEEDPIEYIDCKTCDGYGCFDQMYEQQKSYSNSGSNLYSQSGYHNYNDQDDMYTQYNDDQYTLSYQQRNYGNYGNRQNYQQQQQQQQQQQFSTPMEAALNWVSEVAQCKELKMFDADGSDLYYTNYKRQNNYQQDEYSDAEQNQQSYSQNYGSNSYKSSLRNPYAGMMCNPDGSGMEIGIFMDESCTIYDSSRTYKDIIKNGSPQETYYELTKGLMEFTFTQTIDCKASQYAQPDWDSRADYDYYQQQQDQQQQANQYYSNAEDYYNAYNQQQNENYQQTNEYYQDQSDAYYSYYMNGANVQAVNSCQQLFEQQMVQLGIPCSDGQGQYNQDQQNEQAWRQSYANQNKPYGEYSFFSSYSGRQSYAYELQNPEDQEEVCAVMNNKMANDSFQKNAMSQSRFKNLYNYKLYSATKSWRGFRTRIGEGIQTFRYNAGERFRSIHEEEASTKLAIISFLIVASIAIVFLISRWSAPYVTKGLTHAASHAVDHAERFAEHIQSMRSEESSLGQTRTEDSLQFFNEIESFDFYSEARAEPSGKKHKLFY